VKVLGLIAMVAACNFQATRVDNQLVDASGGEPVDAPAPPVDAAIPDTPVPPQDTQFCYGAGLLRVCFGSLPIGNINLPIGGVLDTSGAGCNFVVGQQGGPQLCVISGTNLTVTGNLVAVGTRPLMLVATDTITVVGQGSIDVSSVSGGGARTGAGGNASECSLSTKGQNDQGGAGGGAGGSFGTAGGKGGTGDQNDNGPGRADGGNPGNTQTNPTVLRGGCAGGDGGNGNSGDPRALGGEGGEGGGAVYLIAATRIAIEGNVFASGAGGRVTIGSNGRLEGAGGGGSGGMVVLDAPTIQVSGRVVANGGAGGGGGGNVGGTGGGNGSTMLWNTRATAGQGDPVPPPSGPAGDGAQGTVTGGVNNLDGRDSDLGAGGGAGGLGVVFTYGALEGGAMMSPTAVRR